MRISFCFKARYVASVVLYQFRESSLLSIHSFLGLRLILELGLILLYAFKESWLCSIVSRYQNHYTCCLSVYLIIIFFLFFLMMPLFHCLSCLVTMTVFLKHFFQKFLAHSFVKTLETMFGIDNKVLVYKYSIISLLAFILVIRWKLKGGIFSTCVTQWLSTDIRQGHDKIYTSHSP